MNRLKTSPLKSHPKEVAVDRDNGRLNGVSVIEAGSAVGHGFAIDEETLDSVVDLGNDAKSGIKTRFTHPDMSNDGLGNELGRSSNFRKSDDGTRVLADIDLLEAARKSPNGDLRGWVLDMADEDPGAIGMSVVMSGDLDQQLDENDEPKVDGDGNTLPPLYRPRVLHANDLVDEPAANRAGLFGNAELSAAGVLLLDEAIDGLFGDPDVYHHGLLAETGLRKIAERAGLVGAATFAQGGQRITLSTGDDLDKAAGFVTRYLDRRGIAHVNVDAGLLRTILSERTTTMKPDPKKSGDPVAAVTTNPPVVTAEPPAALTAQDLAAAAVAENKRCQEIDSLGRLFPDYDTDKITDACKADLTCTIGDARERVQLFIEKTMNDPTTMDVPVEVGETGADKFTAAMTDAIMLRTRMLDCTPERATQIRAAGLMGLGPKQIARNCLRMAGVRGVDRMSDHRLFAESMGAAGRTVAVADDYDPSMLVVGHATGDFPLILANAGNKAMIRGYEMSPITWRLWCKIGNLNDFKTAKRLRLSESPLLVDRPEGMPAEMGTMEEQGEDITLLNRAKGFSYTRQMFVNDDLGAFLDLGRRFGNGAAQTIERAVYVSLTLNSKVGPTMSDSKALFHTDHANLDSGGGGVPSQTLIDEMFEAMMTQLGIGEDSASVTVGSAPVFFLAKPSVAMKISAIIDAPFRGTAVAADAQSLQAPQDRDIAAARAIKVPQLALLATTDWYGVSNQDLSPSYEVAFLNGVQTPRTKTVVGTTVDGTTVVVDMDYGIFPTGGWQGINRNAGA